MQIGLFERPPECLMGGSTAGRPIDPVTTTRHPWELPNQMTAVM